MTTRTRLPALLAAGLLAAVPTAAHAASAPGVSTGNATKVTQTTATLTGSVNPKDVETSYFFQYGPTAAYGAATAPVAAGKGTSARTAATAIATLTPATKYHFRLIARSGAGTARGADHTFTTQKQPLGLALTQAPDPLAYGGAVTINGTLAGSDAAGQNVALSQNAFPFTAGFVPVGNPQLISSTGTFSFPLLSLTITTQYRAQVVGRPITSPVLTVTPAAIVHTAVGSHRVKRGRSVRFAGTVTPARDGVQVAIQKLASNGQFVTVAGTTLKHDSAEKSKFSKHVRITRGGTYRVYAAVSGDVGGGVGSDVTIHSHR